ncbi:MAG: NosD domain-containing protein, partial [Candidatus Aenigmatarchaeota archaeon]
EIYFKLFEKGNYSAILKYEGKEELTIFEVLEKIENVTEEILTRNITLTVVSIEQGKAEINKPVKWKKVLRVINPIEKEVEMDFDLELPENSFDITLEEKENKTKLEGKRLKDKLKAKETKEYVLTYYTEAPHAYEEVLDKYKKIVKVNSSLHYENVLAYTEIEKSPRKAVRLYWFVNSERIDVTFNESFKVKLLDLDNDELIERVEWLIPYLSEQVFEISIIILNPYTYLRDGETWTVAFNTTGKADLVISSPNANWKEMLKDDEKTFDEMEFLDLKCGDNSLKSSLQLIDELNKTYNYSQLKEEDSIRVKKFLIKDYSCDETGYFINKMFRAGYVVLEFEFAGQKAYAYDPSSCQVYINASSQLPYTISQSNTYYCLNSSGSINGQTAITFASGVQNSTLDCQGYDLNSNDTSSTSGVYLGGSNTINNTVKNCNVSNFYDCFYAGASNNTFVNNTAISCVHDCFSVRANFLNFINNTAIGCGFGFCSTGYHNNTFESNIVRNNGNGVNLEGNNYDNEFIGGSILSNTIDYSLTGFNYYVVIRNNFRNTNFTDARKISFGDSKSWFNYNNRTDLNLWLKTSVSQAATITRKLISWEKSLMIWNDSSSSAITAFYNISGLSPNSYYLIYNNSVLTYIFQTDSEGNLPSFTIYLNSEHEIKVQAFCDVFIDNSSLPYTITESNKVYCLAENIGWPGVNGINFASGIQNTTLDCLFYTITSNSTSDTYGIYLTTDTKNNTIKNCIISNFYYGIYLDSSSNNTLSQITAYNNNNGIYIYNSSNNSITGSSFHSNTNYDYYLKDAPSTNNFTQTNFTSARTIYFSDTSSWFNYNNRTDLELWLKTSVSQAATITRKLLEWTQLEIKWEEQSSTTITAFYNLTGLIPNAEYSIYNGSQLTYTQQTDSEGNLNFNLTIDTTARNITVKTSYCDYYIDNSTIPYTITQSNKVYCLAENIGKAGVNGINFQSGVQNTTLDCLGFSISSNATTDTYGIYLTDSSTKNNTIKNCIISNFYRGIYLEYSSNNTLIQITAYNNSASGIYLWTNSNFNSLSNITSYNNSRGIYLYSSSNNSLSNITSYNNNNGIYFVSSSNNSIKDSIIQDNTEYGIYLYESESNLIYNNLFNNTINFYFEGTIYSNYWNTTKQSGTRIYSAGNEIGGNYWTNFTNNGYSDTCTDADKDGFCDEPYTLADNNIDYLPLSNKYEAPSPCQQYISSCSDLNQPNTYYCLNQSILGSSSTACINISANNITLDCQNNLIDGEYNSNTYGIYCGVDSSVITNLSIKDCRISNWGTGIYLKNVTNSSLTNIGLETNR